MHYSTLVASLATLACTAAGREAPDENAGRLFRDALLDEAMERNYENVSYPYTVIPATMAVVKGYETVRPQTTTVTKTFSDDKVHYITKTLDVTVTQPTATEVSTQSVTLTIFGGYGSMDKVKKNAAASRNGPHWIFSLMAMLACVCLGIPAATAMTSSSSPSSRTTTASGYETTSIASTTARTTAAGPLDPDEVRTITHTVTTGVTTTTAYEPIATERPNSATRTAPWTLTKLCVRLAIFVVPLLATYFCGC